MTKMNCIKFDNNEIDVLSDVSMMFSEISDRLSREEDEQLNKNWGFHFSAVVDCLDSIIDNEVLILDE